MFLQLPVVKPDLKIYSPPWFAGMIEQGLESSLIVRP